MDVGDFAEFLLQFSQAPLPRKRCPEDDLNILLLAASQWLFYCEGGTTETAAIVPVLAIIKEAVHALHTRRGRKYPAESYAVDELLVHALGTGAWRLGVEVKPHVRALVHALETCYRDGYLAGDQTEIRKHLHIYLQEAHEGAQDCEEVDCRWSLHTCQPDYWNKFPRDDCRLLPLPQAGCSVTTAPQHDRHNASVPIRRWLSSWSALCWPQGRRDGTMDEERGVIRSQLKENCGVDEETSGPPDRTYEEDTEPTPSRNGEDGLDVPERGTSCFLISRRMRLTAVEQRDPLLMSVRI